MFKANSKVQKHSFGIKDVSQHSKISSGAAASEYLQKKAVLEHYDEIERSAARSEKQYETNKAISNVTMHSLLESQVPMVMNKLHRQGKEIVFKDILFEMFSKSLYLDQEFVIAQENNLRTLVDSFVDGKGGYALLESAYKTTKSPLLKSIMGICESVASKVTRRKINEAKEEKLDVQGIKFQLNEEEKEELDYAKDKISMDELADLVKKKVLTVIQDEKARQAKEEEVENDLREEAEKEADGDDKAVKESIQRAIMRDIPVEESTLFNSLFRHSYKGVLEATAVQNTDHRVASKNEMDQDNPLDEGPEARFDTGMTADDEMNLHGSVQSDIDMDLILAESITKYTLMELCYTIQLENYNHESIRKISQKLLN